MSSVVSMVPAGAFGIEAPARRQKMHGRRVVAGDDADVLVKPMRLFAEFTIVYTTRFCRINFPCLLAGDRSPLCGRGSLGKNTANNRDAALVPAGRGRDSKSG